MALSQPDMAGIGGQND